MKSEQQDGDGEEDGDEEGKKNKVIVEPRSVMLSESPHAENTNNTFIIMVNESALW